MNWDDPLPTARQAFRHGSRSFSAASLLFDRATRHDVTLLYAWCRYCDDTIDGQVLGHGQKCRATDKRDVLDRLERQTRAAFGLEPVREPAFAALQQVARHRQMPMQLALDHLAGFRMDVEGRRYHSIDDTLDYCYHIAGVVGLMMAHVMRQRDPSVLARASDLGIAFQLTNIARDVIEDAANHRLYLPAAWLADVGLGPGLSPDPATRAAIVPVVTRLLDLAETYYRSAEIGIHALPWRSAWAIATASAIYRDIGRQIRRRGAAAWDDRCRTSGMRKLILTAQSLVRTSRGAEGQAAPPMPALTHLGRQP